MEQVTAPASDPAQTAATELQPGQGAPTDGVVSDEGAQPDDAAQAAAAEAEARKAEENRSRANRRFSDLSRERNAALEEAAFYRGQLEALSRSQQPQPAQPNPQAAPAQASGRPNPNDASRYPAGQFDEQYIEDLAEFKAREAIRSVREEDAKRAQFETGKARYANALADAEAIGFEGGARMLERIARADRNTVDLITSAESPAWVAEHFARIPADLDYAMRLPPAERAMFIGKLDAKYTTYASAQPATQAAPAPTNAPANPQPPVTPTPTVGGRGPAPPYDPNKGTMEDYARWRSSLA